MELLIPLQNLVMDPCTETISRNQGAGHWTKYIASKCKSTFNCSFVAEKIVLQHQDHFNENSFFHNLTLPQAALRPFSNSKSKSHSQAGLANKHLGNKSFEYTHVYKWRWQQMSPECILSILEMPTMPILLSFKSEYLEKNDTLQN